tara:strand:+ start:90 stop:416 length:327 start_codon:yes stop_codon:yes gene_type:complete
MPTTYVLKKPVMDANRIQKIAKKVLDETADDRSKALETYDFFRRRVEQNPDDGDSKRAMVECLKLAQNSKGSTLKLVDLFVKMGLGDMKNPQANLSFDNLTSLVENNK